MMIRLDKYIYIVFRMTINIHIRLQIGVMLIFIKLISTIISQIKSNNKLTVQDTEHKVSR